MTKLITVKVPEELKHPLFFSANETVVINQEERQQWKGDAGILTFPYEVLHYQQQACCSPWEEPREAVEWLFSEWKKVSEQCGQRFTERKPKDAMPFMKTGIGLFLICLFWMNSRPVVLHNWEEHVDKLSSKPVNTKERVAFIFLRPDHYPSYIQLKELMLELEKQYYKLAATQNLKKQKK